MRLIDCFRGVVAYTLDVVTAVEQGRQPDYNKVTTDMEAYLSFGQSKYSELGYTPEQYAVARFSVVALVDEMLSTSKWQYKSEWQGHALQRLQFSTAKAGVEFFKQLNNLISASKLNDQQRDMLEVFYYCLCYGFKGMYFNNPSELNEVRKSVYKILLDHGFLDLKSKRPLFARSMELGKTAVFATGRSAVWFYLLCVGLPILVFVLLYTFFSVQIHDAANYLMSVIK